MIEQRLDDIEYDDAMVFLDINIYRVIFIDYIIKYKESTINKFYENWTIFGDQKKFVTLHKVFINKTN